MSAADAPASEPTDPVPPDSGMEGQPPASLEGSGRPPAWPGRVLWGAAVLAILAPFLLFPVTLEAGASRDRERSLGAILRAFDRALAATGWGETGRLLVWVVAGLALATAFAAMWVAFSDDR